MQLDTWLEVFGMRLNGQMELIIITRTVGREVVGLMLEEEERKILESFKYFGYVMLENGRTYK